MGAEAFHWQYLPKCFTLKTHKDYQSVEVHKRHIFSNIMVFKEYISVTHRSLGSSTNPYQKCGIILQSGKTHKPSVPLSPPFILRSFLLCNFSSVFQTLVPFRAVLGQPTVTASGLQLLISFFVCAEFPRGQIKVRPNRQKRWNLFISSVENEKIICD